MKELLLVVQILLSGLLTVLILVQSKGNGLGKTFGGGSTSSFTRRGFEKWIFKFTFFVAFFFIVSSLIELMF